MARPAAARVRPQLVLYVLAPGGIMYAQRSCFGDAANIPAHGIFPIQAKPEEVQR